jgi:hypothetical protein
MNIAEKAANNLLKEAAKDAGEKLLVFHDAVRRLWNEAHSIPAGCGCTPFYADARRGEAKLRECVAEFRQKYGQEELDKLHLTYGVRL